MITSLFIAQTFTNVDPAFLRDWLIVLCCIGGTVYLAMNLVEKFRAKKATAMVVTPDPLNIQQVEKLATRSELEAIKREIDADNMALREAVAESERKSHQDIVAIHNRINTVAENTSAMKGRLDEVAVSLHELVRLSMGKK